LLTSLQDANLDRRRGELTRSAHPDAPLLARRGEPTPNTLSVHYTWELCERVRKWCACAINSKVTTFFQVYCLFTECMGLVGLVVGFVGLRSVGIRVILTVCEVLGSILLYCLVKMDTVCMCVCNVCIGEMQRLERAAWHLRRSCLLLLDVQIPAGLWWPSIHLHSRDTVS